MNPLSLILILWFNFYSDIEVSKPNEIKYIRTEFVVAINNKSKSESLYKYLSSKDLSNQPLLLAYKGATEALIAKHSLFPFTKVEYLNKSISTLEIAIQKSPNSEEIRHIRFNIENKVPSIFLHSNHLLEDKNFLLHFLISSNINNHNKDLLLQYTNTLLNSNLCNKQEVNFLNQISKKCKTITL